MEGHRNKLFVVWVLKVNDGSANNFDSVSCVCTDFQVAWSQLL